MTDIFIPPDIDERERVEAQEARIKRRQEALSAAFSWVASDPRGQRLLHALIEQAGLFVTSSLDAHRMAFDEGRRSVGRFLMAEIQAAAPAYLPTILRGTDDD